MAVSGPGVHHSKMWRLRIADFPHQQIPDRQASSQDVRSRARYWTAGYSAAGRILGTLGHCLQFRCSPPANFRTEQKRPPSVAVSRHRPRILRPQPGQFLAIVRRPSNCKKTKSMLHISKVTRQFNRIVFSSDVRTYAL